jgi:type IV fimbrial biogenesis protein FimT
MKEKSMRNYLKNKKHEAGFTLIELATILVIVAALASIAIPTFSVWLPNYRLRSAARDLYSNFQMAKLGAVKQNKSWAVVFHQGSDTYYVCSDEKTNGWDGPAAIGGDDDCERTVDFNDYEDIYFGHASINKDILDDVFSSGVHIYYSENPPSSGNPPSVVFGPRGTADKGYVYVQNDKETVYGIGTRPSGVIHLKKWTGSAWE